MRVRTVHTRFDRLTIGDCRLTIHRRRRDVIDNRKSPIVNCLGPLRRSAATRTGVHFIFATLLLLLAASSALAQPFTPRTGYVYPAGGKQGATIEVTVGGQYFDKINEARFSGGGIKATVGEVVKPIKQGDFGPLRDRLTELLNKEDLDADTLLEINDVTKKLASFARLSTPAIADTVALKVTIDANAAPGRHELRLSAPVGLSNPLVFMVGTLPEVSRNALQTVQTLADLRAMRNGEPPRSAHDSPPTDITLPTVVNGQVLPGEVDRYRFTAKKGMHVVVEAAARELIPYLANAVPGWFQAAVAIYDADGNELDYADHFRFQPDPVLCCTIPKDGQYTLEIRDSIYRGREDFVYRLSVGELPYITGVFPMGGKAGTKTTVRLTGWNLPSSTLTQDCTGRPPGVYRLWTSNDVGVSNQALFAVDDLPEVMSVRAAASIASKPGDWRQNAQALTLPVIVNGRIDRPGQWDVYSFDGKAGDEVVAEVRARRLGSPIDSFLKLTDSQGRQLAFNDDYDDKSEGLETHHADSYLRFKLPADGTYYIHICDIQRQSGPQYAYRLRISAPGRIMNFASHPPA